MKRVAVRLFLVVTLICSTSLLAQTAVCDPDFVESEGTRIQVKANGADDTDNIQCAVDFAIENRLSIIQLLADSNYFISKELVFQNFNGSFQGRSRQSTNLTVLDNSFDCSADGPRPRGALLFYGGAPTVRYMRISANLPCTQRQSESLYSLIRMTTQPCETVTVRALVDRVDLVSSGPFIDRGHVTTAVSADDLCFDRNLLGSLTVNRSSITGFQTGVRTMMGGGARVDIRFSTFEDVGVGVDIRNARQDTSVGFNKFRITSSQFVTQFDDGPIIDYFINDAAVNFEGPNIGEIPKNRLQVYSNYVALDAPGSRGLFGFYGSRSTHDIQVKDNAFQLNEPAFNVIEFANIDGGDIRGNRIEGEVEESGIYLSRASGWTITENNLSRLNETEYGVVLEFDTSSNFVGFNTGASTVDVGSENIIH